MDRVYLELLNLIEMVLLYIATYGLSDLFVKHMKFNDTAKLYYYLFLGFIGLFIFTLTIHHR